MISTSLSPIMELSDVTSATTAMRSFIVPVVSSLIGIASLVVVFFLVNGGIQYMASSGNPERLDYAKRVIRNALIGLIMVIGAGTLTAILSHAYNGSSVTSAQHLPSLVAVTPAP